VTVVTFAICGKTCKGVCILAVILPLLAFCWDFHATLCGCPHVTSLALLNSEHLSRVY
jgi:hypothetical protein